MVGNFIDDIQVIYHKALQIIENFFPDGDEVNKLILSYEVYIVFSQTL